MRVKKSNQIKRFAFVTSAAYEQIDFINARWGKTASVGDKYKAVNYLLSEEYQLKQLTESLGFSVKSLSVNDTIAAMNAGEHGPFICNHSDTLKIISHYSGEMT